MVKDSDGYPYIPSEYFSASIMAVKMIHRKSSFDSACKIAAAKYGVNVEKISHYVSERLNAEHWEVIPDSANITQSNSNFLAINFWK